MVNYFRRNTNSVPWLFQGGILASMMSLQQRNSRLPRSWSLEPCTFIFCARSNWSIFEFPKQNKTFFFRRRVAVGLTNDIRSNINIIRVLITYLWVCFLRGGAEHGNAEQSGVKTTCQKYEGHVLAINSILQGHLWPLCDKAAVFRWRAASEQLASTVAYGGRLHIKPSEETCYFPFSLLCDVLLLFKLRK